MPVASPYMVFALSICLYNIIMLHSVPHCMVIPIDNKGVLIRNLVPAREAEAWSRRLPGWGNYCTFHYNIIVLTLARTLA